MVRVGNKAPDFKTITESGQKFKLSSLKGKRVFLFFYPEDGSPDCTAEACSIRDSYAAFAANNAVVYGVSGGSSESHREFKREYSLPFPLLMDEDFRISRLYGVYGWDSRMDPRLVRIFEEDRAKGVPIGVYRIDFDPETGIDSVTYRGDERVHMVVNRTSFLIDQQGKVEAIFGGPEAMEEIDTEEHAEQVLKAWGLKL